MGWRDRERRPGRCEAFRDPRPIMLIVCEGQNTEPQYFEQFALHYKNSRVKVKLADETGVPFSLVTVAKRYKKAAEQAAKREHDANLAYDSVWCVFDIDEHPKVHEAREKAEANGIDVAISNPCFELWLILHHRDSPGMQHRHAMKKILGTHVPGYDKKVDYTLYTSGYEQAVVRAKRLEAIAETVGTPGCNPTTDVYRLTESILKDKDATEPQTATAIPCKGTKSGQAGHPESEPEILPAGEMREKYGLTAENRPTIILDAGKVPAALRHLIPLAEYFGVSDDLIRQDILAKTPADELEAMRQAVRPHEDALDAWLAGPEADGPGYSDEYIAFTCLRMAADEV